MTYIFAKLKGDINIMARHRKYWKFATVCAIGAAAASAVASLVRNPKTIGKKAKKASPTGASIREIFPVTDNLSQSEDFIAWENTSVTSEDCTKNVA